MLPRASSHGSKLSIDRGGTVLATHNYSVFTLVRYPSGALERGEKLFLAKSAAAAVARAAVWIQRASIGSSAPELVAISAQRMNGDTKSQQD
jgi:hypothetical protein